MINRASGPLIAAYSLMMAAGVIFVFTPPLAISEVTDYSELVVLWGFFYLIGGFISSIALVLRFFVKNRISLWYFEISGLALLITANFVYAYALARIGLYYQELSVLAISLVLGAFSSGLIARSIETLRLIKVIRGVSTSMES